LKLNTYWYKNFIANKTHLLCLHNKQIADHNEHLNSVF